MKLMILGAGGYGRTVADIAQQSGQYESIQFLDDSAANGQAMGKCADFMRYLSTGTVFYPAFGSNETRLHWLSKLEAAGANILTLVHSTAYVSLEAKLEAGVMVLPGAIVNTGVTVKRGCIINCGAIIDHDCVIEEGTHICLGAIVKACNQIPGGTKVEAGTVIENGTYPLLGDEKYGL